MKALQALESLSFSSALIFSVLSDLGPASLEDYLKLQDEGHG